MFLVPLMKPLIVITLNKTKKTTKQGFTQALFATTIFSLEIEFKNAAGGLKGAVSFC